MNHERRIEILLVALIVILGGFLARALYIPTWPERQVEVSANRLNLDIGEPSKWFSAWSIGDGQAYAVIAVDPSGAKLGEDVKEPAYRFSRAGYSWLAATITLGNDEWVPYGLAAIGLLSLVGILIVAISMRKRLGPKVWFLVLNPAIYLGFAGDTSEPLGALMLALALGSGSLLAAVALGVTRPSYLVGLFSRWRLFGAGIVATALLAVYSLWRFGTEDLIPDAGRVDLPFVAYIENSSFAGWLLLGLAVATLVVGIRRRDWAWVLTGVFVLSFGLDVTADPINAWRAAGMLPVLWAFGPGYEPKPSLEVDHEPVTASVV